MLRAREDIVNYGQDYETAKRTLELVRGCMYLSDKKPTVSIDGDCWPTYGEVVTRYPLHGASKLKLFVESVLGQSTLTFGLISPDVRGSQNEEGPPSTGTLWAWNSKTRTVFKKPFDSMKSHGASSQNVTCFYNKGIKRGDNLCVYRNVKTNRIHFVINGEESKISFSRDVLNHWFGYIRINSESKYSSIQLSLWADIGDLDPSSPNVEPANEEAIENQRWLSVVRVGKAMQPLRSALSKLLPGIKAKQLHQDPDSRQQSTPEMKRLQERCTKLEQKNLELNNRLKETKQRSMLKARELQEELVKLQIECNQHEQEKVELQNRVRDATELDRYETGEGARGICLVMNNVKFSEDDERHGSEIDEKEITALFSEELHFIVEIRRNLDRMEILKTAQEIAAEDHSKYTAFVFFIMSHGDEKDAIQGADGRPVRVADLMREFTPENCPTLKNRPKLFFIQACRGQGTDRRMNRLSLSPDLGIEDDAIAFMHSSDSTLANSVSPREADFMLAFATVPGYKAWRSKVSGSWFIQVLVDVIRRHHGHHHLMDMLTVVNKEVAEIANKHPEADLSFQVPAPTHTLRYQVFL